MALSETEIKSALDTTEAEMSDKVFFGTKQQEKVNALIRDAQGRAASEIRAELAAAKEAAAKQAAELEIYRNAESNPELIETRRQLANETIARTAAEERENAARKNAALFEALEAEGVIAPKDAVKLLSDAVVWKDGALVSTVDGKPVADVVRDFANARPHLVRGSVRGGIGSTPANRPLGESTAKLENLFGKGSSSKLANDLALKDPAAYSRLRVRARECGLIP
jgi:hypothetical protein